MELKIGVCSPIQVLKFKNYLNKPSENHLNLGLGGHAVNRIALGLLEEGHQVEIFTLDPSIKNSIKLSGNNLRINIFPLRGKIRGLDIFRREIKWLKDSINHSNIHIVHAHWTYEYAIAALNSNKPHLITVRDYAKAIFKTHDDKLYRTLRYFMNYYVLKKTSNLVANSSYIKFYLNKDFNLNVDIIPNPLGSGKIITKKKCFNQQNKKIVSVNNGFSSLKNVKSLIIAFSKVRKDIPDCDLHLIGSQYGEYEEAYKWAEVRKMNLGISFLGKQANDDVLEMIENADVLAHPSLEESFGNPLIEAMSKGTPCIGGKNSGAVPWVLDHGNAGLLVDVREPDSIADGIKILLTDKRVWGEYSKKGIKNVEKRFILPVVIEQHLSKYKEILSI